MNRRSFINRLFLFTGALSSGLWVPKPPFTLIPYWTEGPLINRIYSQEYLEALHNDNKPLNIDALMRLLYDLKLARDRMGLGGKILVIQRERRRIIHA